MQTTTNTTDNAANTDNAVVAKPIGQSNLAQTIRSHRKSYKTTTRPDGKKTQNNGDEVAAALLGLSFATLRAFSHARFGKTYEHLNDGHARMCIGNKIRAEYKKDSSFLDLLPKAE